jgi:thiamine-monophosphate kinase
LENAIVLIKDLGEQGLLDLIRPYCIPQSIGDDGAIIHPPADYELVVTTDVLVDGVHFSDRTTSPFDVGWRSVAANLSDLAAMGARPLGITVGLSLPPELPVVWLEQLYQGMQACLTCYETGIVGGDLTRSIVRTVAITALGAVRSERLIRRHTAMPGDAIVITGYHGNADGGLKLLLDSQLGQNLTVEDRQTLIHAHQRPQPRLDVLPILDRLRDDRTTIFQISGMDSSDGLADAIVQICRASQVGAIIDRAAIPLDPALTQLFPDSALASVLYGGEDFELVLCMPAAIADRLVAHLDSPGERLRQRGAAIIGKITQELAISIVDRTQQYPTLNLDLQSGFQHF